MASNSDSHGHHVTPLKVYLGIGFALFILTGITVAVSFVHLGPFNLVVAMGIACVKAVLVALIFMHLYYDDKLYLTIFIMALLMLALFIIITLFDTLRRGDIHQESAQPFQQEAMMYQDSTRAAGGHAAQDTSADTTGAAAGDTTGEASAHGQH